jgi:tetratricopeptide (TPR) repeat protein
MNVSDAPPNGSDRKGRLTGRARASSVRVVIRREDHIGDTLGFVFLEASGGDHDSIIERLREYLGPRIRILKAEIGAERIEIEAAGRRLAEEAARLAEAAEGLRRQGASRSAMAHFKEALALDPFNVMALCGLGSLLAAREDYSGAFRMLCKAREAGGDSAHVLHELGRAAAGMERIATAIVYLERACELAPDNLAIRRTLADLGRKPRATVKLKERTMLSQRDRQNGEKQKNE